MTRETKIGLLVGLAFLLVVGILLSEYITGATDRPAARLADAGHGVNRGVAAPGINEEAAKPVEPQQPVPTPADLTPKPPVAQVTVVAPPQPQSAPPTVIIAQGQPAPTPTPGNAVAPQPGPVAVVIKSPTDPFANGPIAKVAQAMGQPVVAVGGKPAVIVPAGGVLPPDVKPIAATTTGAREYKAQSGDTLSRLAAQVPGGNVRANRDAVVALNPGLQKDPNRVLVGQTYLLPAAGPAAGPQPTPTVVIATNGTPPADKTGADKPAGADAARTYVVKAGDTLSKIASSELGSKSELPTLRKLNADVLKGGDVIRVGMKLNLPAARASLASASIR